jgi:hypothetical protein
MAILGSDDEVSDSEHVLNEGLANRLTEKFKPLGICAYSNCCSAGCSGTYAEEDDDYECREKGIHTISLYLDGMNYVESVDTVYASYKDHKYLKENWSKECEILREWAEIVSPGNSIRIQQPDSEEFAIELTFESTVQLEVPPEIDDEEMKLFLGWQGNGVQDEGDQGEEDQGEEDQGEEAMAPDDEVIHVIQAGAGVVADVPAQVDPPFDAEVEVDAPGR